MANEIPCRKCGYPDSVHRDLRLLGDQKLEEEELWIKHAKLLKCLFGRKRGYEPETSEKGERK